MSLTVVKRPLDFYISSAEVAATIAAGSGPPGDALITKTGHGLGTGRYVYVTEGPSHMLGHWYVEMNDADTFFIREYATASRVQTYTTGDSLTYLETQVFSVPYLSVHTPIIFKLASDLWPINGADTARTITTFTNSNGYTYLTLSGDIKATGVSASLEKIIISGTAALDGVYTILQWYSDSNIVIDLPYSAGNVLSGGTVQYYYYNYHARIRVSSGLSTLFTSRVDKPFEVVAELRCVPDSSGIITVNIADVLKEKISILSNDPAKQGMPDFYDGYTACSIEHAESFDDSNGYTVEESVGSYTDDGVYIFATNGKLPFKSRYFGFSQYVNLNSTTVLTKWMTLFHEPTLTPGKYFDVGFCLQSVPTHVKRSVYQDDVLKAEYTDTIAGSLFGIKRVSVEQSGWTEDRIDLVLMNGSDEVSEVLTINVDNDCSNQDFYLTWLNYLGVFDYWNFKARKIYSVNVEGSRTQEKNIYTNWPASGGEFADTMRQQTGRESRNGIRVESQHLTLEQLEAIKWIVSSPLVQIVTSVYDRRTVIVDGSSVRLYRDQDKLFNIGFTISYTDELPSQSL